MGADARWVRYSSQCAAKRGKGPTKAPFLLRGGGRRAALQFFANSSSHTTGGYKPAAFPQPAGRVVVRSEVSLGFGPASTLLNGRTGHGPVTAKDAAVALLRSQHLPTALARIKSHARIRRHCFNRRVPTVGTRDRRLELDLTHPITPMLEAKREAPERSPKQCPSQPK